MSELDPLTMMEDKTSNNIDLNKKVKLPQQPGPGDPPKVTTEVEYGEEGVALPETTFKSNALAAATWDRDVSLAKLDQYLGLDKGDNFGVRKGLNPMYMDTRDIKNTRFQMGEAQSNWAKTGDALVRLGSDAVGTFIKEFSYLADVQNHISGGSDPSNWLADFITPLQESVSHNFEIFRDNDESVNINDWGWWAEGTAQMGTTVGMLGAMLVTRGVGGAGARFVSALQNVKKVKGTASFLNKLKQSYKMAGAAVPRGMASDFGYAVLSRAGESAMNADETYKSIKEELISQGISEDIAEAKAKEAASEVYKGNWLMLGQDILQQRMFSGILGKNSFFGGSAKKVVENSGKGGVWAKAGKALTSGYGLGKDMIAEGMEEAYQYYVEEQARNKALVSTGLKSGPEYKAFSDFLNDGEMWNSAIWGAFGSAFMAGGMKAVSLLEKRKANIQQNPNIDDFTKAIELQKIDDEIYAKKAKMIHPVQIKDYYDEVANAASTNNPIAVNSILQRMATTSAINDVLAGVEEGGAFTKAEFANDPKAALESLMEDSIKIDEASAEMIKKRGQEYLDTYTKTAALFKANKEKYQDNYIAQAFTLTQMEHKVAKQELAELDATVDAGYSELSKDFKGTANEVSTQIRQQLELQANQNFITQAEKLIDIYKQSKKAEETVAGLEKAKKQAQKKVDEITKSLEEFNKDEAVSAEQKEALKTEGIDLLKNTELGQALISLMTARNFKSATEISAGEALRTASKEKFEKIKKEVEEIERKTKENLEKDTATTAEGETIKNPTSTKENTPEEGEPLTDDEAVNDDDVNVEDGEESANYNSAKDEFAKADHANETKLKTVNGVAWRSSNQNLTSKEDAATFENNELESLPGDDINREGVTKFLEDTSVDLNNYYIQYDVDVERIDKSSIIGEKQFKAIQDGTKIPAIGLLPVKMTIFNKSDNSPVVYKGKQLTIWVHNANPVKDTMSHLEGLQESTKLAYAEKRNHFYHPDVMEAAIVDTVNTKRKVVEASKSDQILTGTLHKVNNGHVIYSENESISDPKFGITPDLKFGIGNGVSIKSGKTSTSIGTKSPKSGVVYVQMPTGGWLPVKTRKVNQEEANLILDIYKEVLTVLSQGGNSKEVTPSKELLAKLKDSGILKYMPKEASLIDYLNTLVYQGSKTKGKRMLQAFVDNKTKRPLLSIGGTLFNIADLQEDSKQRSQAIDMLIENKLRNIEYSRLDDKAYKTAIIQFLTADVTTTPEGNLFVQPTIAHTMVNESTSKPKYKAEKGFKSYTTNEGLYYINEANEVKNADGEVVTNPNIINKVKIANEQSKGTLQSTPGYVKLEDGTVIETTNFNTVVNEEIINEVNLALSGPIDIDVDIEIQKADIERRRQEELSNIKSLLQDSIINEKNNQKRDFYSKSLQLKHSVRDGGIYYDSKNNLQKIVVKDKMYYITTNKGLKFIGDNETEANIYLLSNEYFDAIFKETKAINTEDKINAKYDAEYVDAVNKGEMTKEQAMQALEEAGRKDSSAYAELQSLEQQPTSTQSNIDNKKADIEIGKVGDTEYEVKADGVYYQGKKLDNPENKTHRQLIEADIERRRQEELEEYANDIVERVEDYEVIDDDGDTLFVQVRYKKDGSKEVLTGTEKNNYGNVAKAGAVISDTFYEDIYEKVTKTGERTGKEANLDGRENKINAKYDAEIAALEGAASEKSETTTSVQSEVERINEERDKELLSIKEKKVVQNKLTNSVSDGGFYSKNFGNKGYGFYNSREELEKVINQYYDDLLSPKKAELRKKKEEELRESNSILANPTAYSPIEVNRAKEKIKEINAEYDAKIAALEDTETAEDFDTGETGLFKEDGSLNDDAYETVDAKSLFDLDTTSEVIEDFPTSDTSTVLPDVNISTVEVTTAGESNIIEKEVPAEKTSKRRPLKKIKKLSNIVELGIGSTEKNSNIVTPTTSELDEEGKEINKNCNKKK